LKKSEPILQKIQMNETETMRTRQGKLFFWGFGFALPRLISRPQEGSGEECGRVSDNFHFLFPNFVPVILARNPNVFLSYQK